MLAIRPARPGDASDIAVLVDMASYGLASWLWGGAVLRGEAASVLEIGRDRALRDDGPMTYRRAFVAEIDGTPAGMLRGYLQPQPMPEPNWAEVPAQLRPLLELEAEAPGSWYVNVLAVFPEARRRGVGAALLAKAEELAAAAGTKRMSLVVEDDNPAGLALYQRTGYRPAATRPFVPFREKPAAREWILMVKALA